MTLPRFAASPAGSRPGMSSQQDQREAAREAEAASGRTAFGFGAMAAVVAIVIIVGFVLKALL